MHSFSSSLHHCVFATKRREPLLKREVRERFWPYFGGIARENGMKAMAVGGVADHVHILLSLPATLSLSKAMQLLKGNSSKWIHETFSTLHEFSWQEGYSAFSIGISGVDETCAYIMFLQRHGLHFDDAMLE
jgi:REP element-mobilizing transposase RayT